MHIPLYWAQARLRHATGLRHGATVQRWGWSDTSQADAQTHADTRAREALDALLQAQAQRSPLRPGFRRMEHRTEYGLTGSTPIREEVLERRGDVVKTRNTYGAHCLNTPNVAIADIDLPAPRPVMGFPWIAVIVLVTAAFALQYFYQQAAAADNSWGQLVAMGLVAAVSAWRVLQWWQTRAAQPAEGSETASTSQAQAMARLEAFASSHPAWGMQVYETPKGLRAIATHMPLRPDDAEVQAWFAALQVDPVYAMLCSRQQCFRVRVSAKPWRMGHPSLGNLARRWPVAPDHLPERQAWIAAYEPQAQGYAACRWLRQLGNPFVCLEAQALLNWHDDTSRARTPLPLA